MEHRCAACKYEAEKILETEPTDWFTRCIDSTDYILCDVCGHQSHSHVGISSYLKDMLEQDERAIWDLSAEAAVLGIERRRFRKSPR
ncbi:MAG: hypothetical protein GY927_05895 [bacterium]|nr:hypothetical protein [bacterium]